MPYLRGMVALRFEDTYAATLIAHNTTLNFMHNSMLLIPRYICNPRSNDSVFVIYTPLHVGMR